MNLNEAQKLFKDGMLNAKADPKTVEELKPVGKLSLEAAFQVYNRGYITRLTEALAETFEAVRWVVGKDAFSDLCRGFIESEPSISYNLADHGRTFPEFVRNAHASKGIPFLYDLARFEWSYKKMYDAPTPHPLPAEQIKELLHSDDFKIQFIEGMDIFDSPYAVHEIWNRRKEPAYEFEDINWNHPESLLLYKKQSKILVQRIDVIEAQVIMELKEGLSVNTSLADFSTSMTPDKIAQLFEMMMKAGIIEDVLVLET
ncbi:putative DNA-binding domain-containing protein [Bdellovibrio bacteriovorus]